MDEVVADVTDDKEEESSEDDDSEESSADWAKSRKISLSPVSQKRDPAKRCSFVPAVSERSLRSSKRNGWSRAYRKPGILVLPRASRAEGGKGDRYLMWYISVVCN